MSIATPERQSCAVKAKPKRKFRVCVFEGIAYRKHRGEWVELTCYYDRRGRKSVRIYSGNRRRAIMLNRLVWMAAHRRPIPKGHEVHHKDRNRHNYCWANLECLEKESHKRKHEAF